MLVQHGMTLSLSTFTNALVLYGSSKHLLPADLRHKAATVLMASASKLWASLRHTIIPVLCKGVVAVSGKLGRTVLIAHFRQPSCAMHHDPDT